MMGPETLACSEGEERFLNLWKPPHQWRVQLEQKGTSGAQRRVVCGRRVWDLCRWFVLQPCMPQPEMGVHWWSWKLCTATWGLESTWEGTTLGCEETVWGNGSEKFCNWECLWRKLRPSEKKSTIVEWCIKDRATILASLLPRHLLPPLALRRAPAGAGLHTPSCCLLSLPSPSLGDMLTQVTTWWALVFQSLPQHPPCLGSLFASIATSAPFSLTGLWALVTSGADSGVRNTCRDRAETTAEPQRCMTKEEELKFLLLVAPTTESHLCRQIPNFKTCETSTSVSVSAAETGLALAAL